MSVSYEFRSDGWNTLDVNSIAAVVHFPTKLEIRAGLASADGEPVWREFWWYHVERLGAHTPNCSYASATLQVPEARLFVEFASDKDTMVVRATCESDTLRPLVEVLAFRGTDGQVCVQDGAVVGRSESDTFFFSTPRDLPGTPTESRDNIAAFFAKDSTEMTVVASPNSEFWTSEQTSEFIARKRQEAEDWEHRFDEPDLQAAFEGMWRSVIWNTIYAPSMGRPVTVVSRDWCREGGNYGDFVLFEWDTFFAALQCAYASKQLAYANVRAVLSGVTERGFVPSIHCELGKSRDRSMLPVGAMVVLKLYERFADKDFLAEVFPALVRWHDWWMAARDGNGDGLLEWGSDNYPSPHPQWQAYTLQAARYESGLDNSPMYDDVIFNQDTNTMNQADVGLNAAYAMDAWALAAIASELGEAETANRMKEEHKVIMQRINEKLWSEDAGIYLNRYWSGEFSDRIAPTSFYPLIGRVAEPERAKRMIDEHLLNENEFWGEHVIPSISRSDPAYPDQEYWRGRIWGPMNWLVYEGLVAYGFTQVSREMGKKCLGTFLGEWLEESHVHENYNGTTGDGDDAQFSDPVYFWGGLLALIGLLESGKLQWRVSP